MIELNNKTEHNERSSSKVDQLGTTSARFLDEVLRPVKEVSAVVAEHPLAAGIGVSAVVGLAFLSRGRNLTSTASAEKTLLGGLELPKLAAQTESRIPNLTVHLPELNHLVFPKGTSIATKPELFAKSSILKPELHVKSTADNIVYVDFRRPQVANAFPIPDFLDGKVIANRSVPSLSHLSVVRDQRGWADQMLPPSMLDKVTFSLSRMPVIGRDFSQLRETVGPRATLAENVDCFLTLRRCRLLVEQLAKSTLLKS